MYPHYYNDQYECPRSFRMMVLETIVVTIIGWHWSIVAFSRDVEPCFTIMLVVLAAKKSAQHGDFQLITAHKYHVRSYRSAVVTRSSIQRTNPLAIWHHPVHVSSPTSFPGEIKGSDGGYMIFWQTHEKTLSASWISKSWRSCGPDTGDLSW